MQKTGEILTGGRAALSECQDGTFFEAFYRLRFEPTN